MQVEQLPYGERVFYIYREGMPFEQKYTGYVRPMCMEEIQTFVSGEELFDQILAYLNRFMMEPIKKQVLNPRDSHALFMQKANQFYVVEVYYSQDNSLQGFIRGREYPQRTAFRNKEGFCRLLAGKEPVSRRNAKTRNVLKDAR